MVNAYASSWKHEPFTDGKPILYKAVWGDDQFARIRAGLVPRQMEDKWFIFYEDPHVFFHRSWTGQPIYRLTVARITDGYEVTEALSSLDFEKEAGADPIYQVKLLDFLVCTLLLGKPRPFPLPSGAEEQTHPGALQHVISGTSYREESTNPRKPWWRFW